MNEQDYTKRLQFLRQEINSIDKELLSTLNKRAAVSIEIGRIKKQASAAGFEKSYEPLREKDILDKLIAENSGPLPQAHLRNMWREFFSSSRSLQSPQYVAYLGPEGTFSYFAGSEYLGHCVEFRPYTSFHDIFRAVFEEQCTLGIVPLENSIQGTIGQCFDLFHNFQVSIQAEVLLRIHYALVSPHLLLTDIKYVYSHAQPLAQCEAWLRTHMPWVEHIPVKSTADAARRATEEKHSAAIGHPSLGTLYSLNTLATSLEASTGNWTRYVIIAPMTPANSIPLSPIPLKNEAFIESQRKTSIIFTLPDKPGSLCAVLDSFARHNVNLRKLESRPLHCTKGNQWRYVFFVDVEHDLCEPSYIHIVEQLRSICDSFRILGSYATLPPNNSSATFIATGCMDTLC